MKSKAALPALFFLFRQNKPFYAPAMISDLILALGSDSRVMERPRRAEGRCLAGSSKRDTVAKPSLEVYISKQL